MFRQGRTLLAAGKTTEACTAFEESERLEAAPTTLLNLASCREKNGQLATAWGLFLQAERDTRNASDPSGQQMHVIAAERAQKLEPRVSKLSINVPQSTQRNTLEIERDKQRIDQAMWNRSLPTDGGTYVITASAPGARTWSTSVTIGAEGDAKIVNVPELSAPFTGTPIETARPAPVSRPLVPLVVGAGSLALLGAALGFDVWGSSNYNAAKAEMTSQGRRDSLEQSANHKRYAAEGLAVAGLAAAGIAVMLYLRSGPEAASPTETSHVRVTPNGVAFAGSF